jgi:putative hemolysin
MVGCFQGGCAGSTPSATAVTTARPGLLSRDLLATEKATLGHVLSRTFKDPGSAQFQWGPVWYAPNTASTEYCGIVNSKNSYGAYTGYQMFHATLYPDAKGQYTSGTLDGILADNATGDQLKTNVHYEELCIEAGYGKLSLVPQ